MLLTFYDAHSDWLKMLPLSYTRPVAKIRVGILEIHEKWTKALSAEQVAFRSEDYLSDSFASPKDKSLTISGNVLPDSELVEMVSNLQESEAIMHEGQIIVGFYQPDEEVVLGTRKAVEIAEVSRVEYPWDIFRLNGEQIRRDFREITKSRKSQDIDDPFTRSYGTEIFLEKGASVKAAVLNAEQGPIYIGENAEVQEGALIRGPFALGAHSVVNMGAKLRGDTTVGPHCKVGGEISNAVFQGYSNKGHDGFLGNSVLGEWCNLGADTNNSNLKNNYANVKMWDFASGRFKDTGLQFCGLIMGDHSKCGINTMFNTGTTVGVSANIFGEGFPRNIIPSFAWGGASGFSTYQLRKVFETADLVMSRRGKSLTEADKAVLSHIFDITSENRVWDRK